MTKPRVFPVRKSAEKFCKTRTYVPPLPLLALAWVLCWPTAALAARVHALFSATSASGGPFPTNLFSVPDASHNTGIRVNYPKPDCQVFVSACEGIEVLNTLDGFNPQPQLYIPFSGPIDVTTVSSETVFLISLGDALPGGDPGGKVIGINQIVWDVETNALVAAADEFLDQHTRYAVIVTRGVKDTHGKAITRRGLERFLSRPGQDAASKAYNKSIRQALTTAARVTSLSRNDIVAASVFTTLSTTAVLEKIRDQIKAATPAPADFLLGSDGARTVFPLSEVTSITITRQVGADPNNPASFVTSTASPFLVPLLHLIPGAVGQIAFGKYRSPDYETAGKYIPDIGTKSGSPQVQGENDIFFNLFLPSGSQPPGGWPVAIFGHGLTDEKNIGPFLSAAAMSANGIATIAINAVGHGAGPFGFLTVNRLVAEPMSFLSGGRGLNVDGDGIIQDAEGHYALPPRGLISNRDGLRQTVVDLMQLVHVIEVGMDVNGDDVPDLDPSRIYYFGASNGGIYGIPFLAVEPSVRAGVSIVAGGPGIEIARLSPFYRPSIGLAFAFSIPPLINIGGPSGLEFNGNLPLRNQPPVINTVPGAIALQAAIETIEWASQAGNPVAYAPHLRKKPLARTPVRPVIIQFARGDQFVPNPTTTAMLRAGDLIDRATFYRHDLAFADPLRNPTGNELPKDSHGFTAWSPLIFPAGADIGFGAQQQIATFFTSDGAVTIDPDGPGPLFETPIVGPLPEDCGFVVPVPGFPCQ